MNDAIDVRAVIARVGTHTDTVMESSVDMAREWLWLGDRIRIAAVRTLAVEDGPITVVCHPAAPHR